MENSATGQPASIPESVSIRTGFIKSPWTSTSLFGLTLLLFFLPFVTIRCNNEPIARATGVDLAFGVPMKSAGTLDRMKDRANSRMTISANVDKKTNPNPYALIAMGLALIGAVVTVLHFHQAPWMKSVIAGLAMISMVFLYFDINEKVHEDQDPVTGKHALFDKDSVLNIHADFSVWYYLAIFLLLLVVIIGIWQWRTKRSESSDGAGKLP